jgi:hypothetical protein
MVGVDILHQVEQRIRQQIRALGIEHGALHVEEEAAGPAGSERELAGEQRSLADDRLQAVAGRAGMERRAQPTGG